ncbi:MAG: hypothetical protein ACRYG2_00065 [Janthinobacterium lividum]
MSTSRVPRLSALALSTALAASGILSACSSDQPVTEDVYCADANGKVIDESYCDDGYRGFGGGFIWIGGFGGGRGLGYQLPVNQRTSMVPYNDPVARQSAGLPRTGRVTGSGGLGGTVTRSRSASGTSGSGTRAGTSKGGGFGGSEGGAGS